MATKKKEEKQELPFTDKYSGIWNGKEVKFKREFSGHQFTDEECEALLNGAEISFEATSKTGNKYTCYGSLAEQSFTNKEGKEVKFVGFKPDFETKRIPPKFVGHVFTEEEIEELEKGNTVYATDLISKAGKEFSAYLRFDKKEGMQMAFNNSEE